MLVVVIAVVVVVVTYPAGDHCVCPHKPHVRDEATGAGEVWLLLTTLPPVSGGHGIGMGVWWGEGGGGGSSWMCECAVVCHRGPN